MKLSESQAIHTGEQDGIDATPGILRDVKILGFQSANTADHLGLDVREYGEALQRPYTYDSTVDRSGLYDGLPVHLDHERADVSAERRVLDLFGEVQGCYRTEDGYYARELRYSTSHPAAGLVADLAKNFPKRIGLSHVADGDPRLIDDHVEIVDWMPICVDIVTSPATTAGLYEGKIMARKVKRTIRSVLREHKVGWLLKEMEDDKDEMLEQEIEVEPAEPAAAGAEVASDPAKELRGVLLALINRKLEAAGPSELEALLQALGMENSLTAALAAGEPAQEAEEPADGDLEESEQGDDSKASESRRQGFDQRDAKIMLLEAGREVSDMRIRVLMAANPRDRKGLVESWGRPEKSKRPSGSVSSANAGHSNRFLKRWNVN